MVIEAYARNVFISSLLHFQSNSKLAAECKYMEFTSFNNFNLISELFSFIISTPVNTRWAFASKNAIFTRENTMSFHMKKEIPYLRSSMYYSLYISLCEFVPTLSQCVDIDCKKFQQNVQGTQSHCNTEMETNFWPHQRFLHLKKLRHVTHPEKVSLTFSSSSIVTDPSFTILAPLWFIIISRLFYYLGKLLFSSRLRTKDNSAPDYNISRYRDFHQFPWEWGVARNLCP